MRGNLHLFWQLTRRDIQERYRGTAIGVLWSLITPLAMLIVYTFVFSEVFRARWTVDSDDKVGFAMNLFAGLIVHGLFAECAGRSSGLIRQHSSFVKRVVFPLWLLAPVLLGSALFQAFVSMLVLLAAQILFYEFIHWQVVWLPVILLPLIILMLGMVWFIAALGVYLRDIGQVIPVVVTAMLFMAPVFYPVSALPEAYQSWLYLNPLTPAIEMVRGLIVEGQLPSLLAYGQYLSVCLLVACLGWGFFSRVQKGFADVI